ncbi:MAG: GtrA family protein [Paludibacteraceae bacterium]|nr:GtrA family protein [Paludibacteraceae bacterium]
MIRSIEWLYPLARRWMPRQLFRYGICGVANLVFDWILYFCFFHFIFKAQDVDFGFFTLSPHIAAFACTFPITLASGFYLARHVSFRQSTHRRRTQAWRYVTVVFANWGINIFGLKLLVDVLAFYPTPSKMLITVVTTIFSYLAQKKFTF